MLKSSLGKILRKAEKITKTDMVYLTKGSAWLGLQSFVSLVTALGLAIAFDRLLPKEMYGMYRYVISTIAIIGSFSLTGLGHAIIQSVSRGHDEVIKKIYWINFRWTLATALITMVASLYYFIQGNMILGASLLIVSPLLPFLKSAQLYSPYLNGKKEFRTLSMFSVYSTIIPALILLSVLFVTDSPIALIGAHFAAQTIVTSILYFITVRKKNSQESEEMATHTANYGKHLGVMNVITVIAEHIDKVLLFHFFGAGQLAIYTFASMIPTQIKNQYKILTNLILPKFSNRTIRDIKSMIWNKFRLLMLISAIIVGLYILAAPYIFKYLFPQYIDAVFYSQLYSLVFLLLPSSLLLTVLISHSKKKQLYYVRTVIPLIRITAYLIFLPMFGIIGAIFSLIGTRIIGTSVLAVLIHKLHD